MKSQKMRIGNRTFISYACEVLVYIILFFFIAVVSPRYVYGKSVVEGHSMENTLFNKDVLIQEKISYMLTDPKRYDIVIVTPWEEEAISNPDAEHWVKRIIGLPGETIQIIESRIYIDGELLENEYYGTGKITNYGIAAEPYQIAEAEYFLMGDNREGFESYDSRDVGTFKREQIEGQVIFRLYPFDRIGILK